MKLKKYLILVIGITMFFISGCATFQKEKNVVQTIGIKNKNKKVMEKISTVFTNNGYTFEILNENLGIIKTEWKDITDKSTQTSNKIAVVGAVLKGTLDRDTIYMQLNVKLNNDNYTLIPKVKKVTIEKGLLITETKQQPYNFNLEKTVYGEQVEKIIREINKELKIDNNYQWVVTEK